MQNKMEFIQILHVKTETEAFFENVCAVTIDIAADKNDEGPTNICKIKAEPMEKPLNAEDHESISNINSSASGIDNFLCEQQELIRTEKQNELHNGDKIDCYQSGNPTNPISKTGTSTNDCQNSNNGEPVPSGTGDLPNTPEMAIDNIQECDAGESVDHTPQQQSNIQNSVTKHGPQHSTETPVTDSDTGISTKMSVPKRKAGQLSSGSKQKSKLVKRIEKNSESGCRGRESKRKTSRDKTIACSSKKKAKSAVTKGTEADTVSMETDGGNKKLKSADDKCTMCYKDVQCKDHVGEESKGGNATNKKFQCDVCGGWFKHTYTLRKHKCNHEGKYVCSICNKRYGLPSYLKRHMKNHTEEKVRYHCKYCDKALCSTSSLRAHERLHTLDKPFKCDICDKCFTQSSNLSTHKKIHNDVKPFVCELCNKPFRHKQSLLVHLRSHTKERPYTCATCGQTFTQNTHMRTHERLHAGIKPYKCKLCDKTFSRKHHLDYHLETHSGKTYKCSVCEKSFTAERAVIQHERIHTGETPYKCDVCGKEFKYHGYLSVHKRIHTGDMPFKCSFCPKEFIVASSLQQHLKHNHHNETENYLSAKRCKKTNAEGAGAKTDRKGVAEGKRKITAKCSKKRLKVAQAIKKTVMNVEKTDKLIDNAKILQTVAVVVNDIKSSMETNHLKTSPKTGKTKQDRKRNKEKLTSS